MIARFIKTIWISMVLAVLFMAPAYAASQNANNRAEDISSTPPTPEMQREVDEINQNIRRKGAKWKAGVTSMTRLSPEERKKRSGHLPSLEERKHLKRLHPELSLPEGDESSQLFSSSTSTSSSFLAAPTGASSSLSTAQASISELAATLTLPPSLDYRNYNGGNYVTSVKDQMVCGSCWAFASTAALESRVLLDLNMPGVDLDLSEKIVVSCSGYGSCAGGNVVTDFFVNTGLSPESYFPGSTGDSCSTATPGWQLDTYKVTGYQELGFNNVDDVKAALYTYGPMYVSMVIWREFSSYTSGVYSWSGIPQLYDWHAVELIGYDDNLEDPEVGGYFIAKNSWGLGWGEEGFFRIAYSERGASFAWSGTAYTGAYKSGLVSLIYTPNNNAAIKGTNYIVTGIAAPNQGSAVREISVSTDGGASWHLATDTSSDGSWRTWSYNWTLPADGIYTLMSRAVDNEGAVESPKAGFSVTVDNTVPEIYGVVAVVGIDGQGAYLGPLNGVVSDGRGLFIYGNMRDNWATGGSISKAEFSTDGGTWNTASLSYVFFFDWLSTASGPHEIKIRVFDRAGNVSPEYIANVTALFPTSTITAPADGAFVYGSSFLVTGTAMDMYNVGLQKVEVSTDEGATWALATGTSSWSYTLTLGATYYHILSRVTDNAGHVEAPGAGITVWANIIPLSITTSGMPAADTAGAFAFDQPLTAIGGTPPYTWSVAAGNLPPGLDLLYTFWNGPSIWGVPTTTGQYPFTLQVVDSSNPVMTATLTFQINVYEPVTITTDLPGSVVNVPYTKAMSAIGGVPPYTWSADALPPGLTINSSTGVISGTAITDGGYSFAVQAVDSVGLIGTRWYYLTVYRTISISTSGLPAGIVGQPYIDRNDQWNPDIYLRSEGGTGCDWEWCNPRNIWSITGALPIGITFDTVSGRLSGTPTEAGTYDITFQVTDPGSGNQGTKTFQLVINPVEILDNGLAAGTLNKPYSDTLSAGGMAPFTWSAGNLPPGVTINPGTGVLSGTPAAIGIYQVAVQVTDATGASSTSQLELSISDIAEQWAQVITGDGGDARRVAMDADGNVYVLANFYNLNSSGTNDLLLRKYSPTGTEAWSLIINDGEDSAVDMTLDGGSIYLLNNVYDYNTGVSDPQIVMVAADGVIQSKLSTHINDYARSLKRDASGNFYVMASIYNGVNTDIKVFKFDLSGAQLWSATYDSGNEDYADAMTVDAVGNIYAAGGRWGSEEGNNGSLFVKFDSSGNQLWANTYHGLSGENESYGIAVDNMGNVYATGESYSASQDNNLQTLKFDASGNLLWASIYDRIGKTERGEGVVLDGKGNLYVVGQSDYRTMDNRDYLIVKYDTSGNILWSKNHNTQGTDSDRAYSIALDQNDNLAVIGNSYNQTTYVSEVKIVKFFRTDLAITVIAIAGANGTITPSGAITAHSGEQLAFTVTPNTGYRIALVTGCSGTLNGSTYTTGPITADCTVSATFAINPEQFRIATTTLPGGHVNAVYGQLLTTAWGIAPYTWSLAIGSLPPGLTLSDSSGAISGIPTAAGSYSFTIQAVDNNSAIAIKSFTINVDNELVVATSNLRSGAVNVSYSQTLYALNGSTPYTWSITSGSLPTGLSMDSASGGITGIPSAAGTFTCTVQVSDAQGLTANKLLNITIVKSGDLWTWGWNSFGTLGNGTTINNSTTPIPALGLSNVVSFAGGHWHAGAVKSDGTVWAWGANWYGALGNGTSDFNDHNTPGQVSEITNAVAYAGGSAYSSALRADGTVWAWGTNNNGQLGDGTGIDRLTPVQVSGLTNIVAISSGASHMLALKDDGTVWAWGYNRNGTLGDGTGNTRYSPIQVSGLTDIVSIAGESESSIALNKDGTVWAWGCPLQDSTTNCSAIPAQVGGLTNMVAIATGRFQSLALKNDGTVWAWGNNYSGELGDGTTNPSLTPVQVIGLTDVASIAGGNGHSLALKNDGTIWAWGDNGYGELGDGTTTSHPTAVQVNGISNALNMSTGWFFGLASMQPLNIETALLADGTADSPYSQTLAASGGSTQYTWSIVSGILSPGLSLSTTGLISGTPTTAGTSTFTVQVADAASRLYAKDFSIGIAGLVTAQAGANGSITPFGTITANGGDLLTFTMTPDSGYYVASVTGCNGSLNGNVYTTGPVTANCTVTAMFAVSTYTVTSAAGPNGTISPSTPQPVNYNLAASFTLTPNNGYHIDTVSGCNGTLNNSTYTTGPVTADCTVTAEFAIDTHSLTVTKAGTGSGTVTSSPNGINCGTSCTATYDYGTSVTLTAAQNSDSLFAGWSGGGCSGTGTCVTTMDADNAAIATFAQYITITTPNGGEGWIRGTTYTIRWNYAGNPGSNVKIELLKGGVVNRTITSTTSRGTGGSGSYDWRIPNSQTTGSDYTIRVTSTSNSNYSDTSNANLIIL